MLVLKVASVSWQHSLTLVKISLSPPFDYAQGMLFRRGECSLSISSLEKEGLTGFFFETLGQLSLSQYANSAVVAV